MGGTNQKTLTPAVPQTANVGSAIISSLRIHENNGEVHLHDDANSRKFACPVAEFYSGWKNGKSSNFANPLVLVGHDGNGNPLSARFEKVISNGKLDVSISFDKVESGDTINQIDDFVNGR
jgi:hypothetical protein